MKLLVFPGTNLKNIPNGLRSLADEIESGELDIKSLTMASDKHVFHLGDVNDEMSVKHGIFNLTFGIQMLSDLWRLILHDRE